MAKEPTKSSGIKLPLTEDTVFVASDVRWKSSGWHRVFGTALTRTPVFDPAYPEQLHMGYPKRSIVQCRPLICLSLGDGFDRMTGKELSFLGEDAFPAEPCDLCAACSSNRFQFEIRGLEPIQRIPLVFGVSASRCGTRVFRARLKLLLTNLRMTPDYRFGKAYFQGRFRSLPYCTDIGDDPDPQEPPVAPFPGNWLPAEYNVNGDMCPCAVNLGRPNTDGTHDATLYCLDSSPAPVSGSNLVRGLEWVSTRGREQFCSELALVQGVKEVE